MQKEEIEMLKNFLPKQDREHPVKRLLLPQTERDRQVTANTNIAIKNILQNHKDWILGLTLKTRLLETKNFPESSSALAEIRAFGDLLSAGISVEPVPVSSKKTPDFVCHTEDGQKIYIEVQAKQLNKDEAKSLSNFRNQSASGEQVQYDPHKSPWNFQAHICTPFGKPNLGENVTENVISKIAQRKNTEGQFSEDNPAILWLDFQDESWDLLSSMMVNKMFPVISWQGAFYSGEIWYAFYGWKDAPILEPFTTSDLFVNMRHPGRFTDTNTKIDAAIVSFDRNIVALENPLSKKPVTASLWKQMVLHRYFTFERSYINWPVNNLTQRIDLERDRIKALAKELP